MKVLVAVVTAITLVSAFAAPASAANYTYNGKTYHYKHNGGYYNYRHCYRADRSVCWYR